jgi:hypothetical protein
VLHGGGLRSSPDAQQIEHSGGRLVVRTPWEADEPSEAPASAAREPGPATRRREGELHGLEAIAAVRQGFGKPEVQREIVHARNQIEHLRRRPHAWKIYSRPILRGLLQALSVVAPEVGLAAFALESGIELAHAKHVRRLLAKGPSSQEARAALKELEPRLQQLSHRQALEVLNALLAEFGR